MTKVGIGSGRGVEPEVAQLAVKRRAADAEAPRDFAHPAAIMADREADAVGLDLFERPQIDVGQTEGDSDRFAVDCDVAVAAPAAGWRRLAPPELVAGPPFGFVFYAGSYTHRLTSAGGNE